jgi:ribosomal protein L34E
MATQRICDACGAVLAGGPKWELREMLPVSNTTSRPIKTYDLCSSGCLVAFVERGDAEEQDAA